MIEHDARVLPDWIDSNGHMNLAFYVLVFEDALSRLLAAIGVAEAAARVEESHTRYEREVRLGEPLRVTIRVVAAEGARLRVFAEMAQPEAGYRAATQEVSVVCGEPVAVAPSPPPDPRALGRRVAMP